MTVGMESDWIAVASLVTAVVNGLRSSSLSSWVQNLRDHRFSFSRIVARKCLSRGFHRLLINAMRAERALHGRCHVGMQRTHHVYIEAKSPVHHHLTHRMAE